jgi:hypothetical protein
MPLSTNKKGPRMNGSIDFRFFTAFCDVLAKECKLGECKAIPWNGQDLRDVARCLGAQCLQLKGDGSGQHLMYTDIPALYREYSFNTAIRNGKCKGIYRLYSEHLQRMLGAEVEFFNENERIVISIRRHVHGAHQ